MLKAKAEDLSLMETEALRIEEEEKKEMLQLVREMAEGRSNAVDEDQFQLELQDKNPLDQGGTKIPNRTRQSLMHQPWKSWKVPHGHIIFCDDKEAEETASKLLSSFDEFQGQKHTFTQFRE